MNWLKLILPHPWITKGRGILSNLYTYMNIDIRLLSAVTWQQKCHKQSCTSLEAASDHEEQKLHVA